MLADAEAILQLSSPSLQSCALDASLGLLVLGGKLINLLLLLQSLHLPLSSTENLMLPLIQTLSSLTLMPHLAMRTEKRMQTWSLHLLMLQSTCRLSGRRCLWLS